MKITNVLWGMVFVAIFMNLSIEIVAIGVKDSNNTRIFDNSNLAGMSYNENYTNYIVTQEHTVQPESIIEDSSDSFYQLIDKLSLGFFSKLFNIIDRYLFGFINILHNSIGQWLDPELRTSLFGDADNRGMLKTLMFTIYILAIISMYTNKQLEES